MFSVSLSLHELLLLLESLRERLLGKSGGDLMAAKWMFLTALLIIAWNAESAVDRLLSRFSALRSCWMRVGMLEEHEIES